MFLTSYLLSMRSGVLTWQCDMGPNSFWSVLRSLLNRRRSKWHCSPPQLVNGSLAPPPSRFYPGTMCYMIVLTVDNVQYFGFGPTPSIARHFASFEAYNALHPLPSEEVKRVRNTLPLDVLDSAEGSDSEVDNIDPEFISTRLDYSANRSDVSDVSDNDTAIEQGNSSFSKHLATGHPPQTASSEPNDSLFESQKSTSSKNDLTTKECAALGHDESSDEGLLSSHVTEDSSSIPNNLSDLENRIQRLRLGYETMPSVWVHGQNVPLKKRDIFVDLDEIAMQKGVVVSFEKKKCGNGRSKSVLVTAKAAGFQFTGRHQNLHFAKCEAAVKLMSALAKLPDAGMKLKQPPRLSQERDLPPQQVRDPTSPQPSQVCQVPPQPQDQSPAAANKHARSSEHHSVDASSNKSLSTSTRSPPSEPAKKSPQRDTNLPDKREGANTPSNISPNPIGQLQELMLKQHLDMPVYSEKVKSVGKYTEYICTVSAKGLSAKGIGYSKKLARRHAAENLLAVMETQDMNIDPAAVKMKARLKPSSRVRTTTYPPSHRRGNYPPPPRPPHFLPHSPPPPPEFSTRPPFIPGKRHRPYFPGPRFPVYQTRGHFHPPHNVAQPYGPPPPSLPPSSHTGRHPPGSTGRRSLLPPPNVHVPMPQHRPFHEARWQYMSETETESESEYTEISSGLYEMIPFQPDSFQLDHHRGDECVDTENGEGSTPISGATSPASSTHSLHQHSSHKKRNHLASVQKPSHPYRESQNRQPPHYKSCERKFSDVECPFDTHSDPFQFTTRLPRQRKEPWTKPGKFSDTNPNSAAAKPPWGKIRREAGNTSVTRRSLPMNSPPRNPDLSSPPVHPLMKQMKESSLVEPNEIHKSFPIKPVLFEGLPDLGSVSHEQLSVSPDPSSVSHDPLTSSDVPREPLTLPLALKPSVQPNTSYADPSHDSDTEMNSFNELTKRTALVFENAKAKLEEDLTQPPDEESSPNEGDLMTSPVKKGIEIPTDPEEEVALIEDLGNDLVNDQEESLEHSEEGMHTRGAELDNRNVSVEAGLSASGITEGGWSRSPKKRKKTIMGQYTFMAAQAYLQELINEDTFVCMPSEGAI